jgi:hypothetical protein
VDHDHGSRGLIIDTIENGSGISTDSSRAHVMWLQDAGASSSSRAMRSRITADVMRAISEVVEMEKGEDHDNKQSGGGGCTSDGQLYAGSRLRRAVMKRLRQLGHNAAICKSRWRHGGGVAAGKKKKRKKKKNQSWKERLNSMT